MKKTLSLKHENQFRRTGKKEVEARRVGASVLHLSLPSHHTHSSKLTQQALAVMLIPSPPFHRSLAVYSPPLADQSQIVASLARGGHQLLGASAAVASCDMLLHSTWTRPQQQDAAVVKSCVCQPPVCDLSAKVKNMSSGVQCTDECVTKFNELKLKVAAAP